MVLYSVGREERTSPLTSRGGKMNGTGSVRMPAAHVCGDQGEQRGWRRHESSSQPGGKGDMEAESESFYE